MKELNEEAKQALLAPFQAAEVRIRTEPYTAAYITARVVMTRLDEALPFQWSFRLYGPGVTDANGVMQQDGVLILHGPNGQMLEFHDRGSAPKDVGRGQAKQAKHAVSDCFKRCAVHVGIGRYLYELAGVGKGSISKAGLEKALAAVGYRGVWDDRHYGTIGGIREADLEDDYAPPPVAPEAAPAAPTKGDAQAMRERAKALLSEAFPCKRAAAAWLARQFGAQKGVAKLTEEEADRLVTILESRPDPKNDEIAKLNLYAAEFERLVHGAGFADAADAAPFLRQAGVDRLMDSGDFRAANAALKTRIERKETTTGDN